MRLRAPLRENKGGGRPGPSPHTSPAGSSAARTRAQAKNDTFLSFAWRKGAFGKRSLCLFCPKLFLPPVFPKESPKTAREGCSGTNEAVGGAAAPFPGARPRVATQGCAEKLPAGFASFLVIRGTNNAAALSLESGRGNVTTPGRDSRTSPPRLAGELLSPALPSSGKRDRPGRAPRQHMGSRARSHRLRPLPAPGPGSLLGSGVPLIFLKEIENCIENPELLARCFLKRKEDLQIYEKYCQNKPRSEALWRQCGDSIFFQECQRKLDHKLSLDAYLLKPVQRITKYQLLLKEMLKCSKNSEGTAELEEALATMLDIIKSVNDSMHQIAITGYEGDVSELGKLLMQGSFNVWTDHKKGHNKVKDLARFKPMQRHLFLYTKMLLFCKKREENTDGHEKTASYSFKNSLKMSTVGITENVKGDNKKFEIWYNGREEVYIIQASSVELKNTWISEIRKVLTGQLEACREASQLHQRITESVYHAPMDSNASRYSRKSSSIYENKSETSNVEASNNKNRNSSPSAKQKRVDASTSLNLERTALARKRFTLQGLSNRRAPPKDPESKDREVTRRFSLASSISTTVNASAVTKGPLVPAVKVKRHEIKSDPTPLGFEDAFENTILAQTNSNTGSTMRSVPRSASQTGWPSRQMPSLDTFEDFEAIPSSMDELSNSSDLEEETNPNNGSNLFRVEGSFDSCFPDSLTLEDGDLVQFVQEGENGQWLVKKLVSEKSDWVPSSILQPAEGDSNNIIKNSNADMYNDSCSTASVESDTKESEVAKSFPAEQRAGS
ncbi:PREDICTED: guanine nucleotide exchange factor DBS-like [Lepidothrix coronata]|uniref:Guanine nucleotide exchange factor DBS-like n=1 Tax=Lepidothrix coronata TaxID=321398 RepID=A0A6J0GVX1_9PASS|nr:PREDICTED: guanine nucleotide exchange factor DBS-like [Lepidothrix coronata]